MASVVFCFGEEKKKKASTAFSVSSFTQTRKMSPPLLSCHVLDGSSCCQCCFNTLISYTWKDLFQNYTSHPLHEEKKSELLLKRAVLNFNPYLTKWKHRPLYFPHKRQDYFLLQMDILWFGIDFFIYYIFNIFKWWIEVTLAVGRCVR